MLFKAKVAGIVQANMIEPFLWRKSFPVLFLIMLACSPVCLAHTTGLSTSDLKFGTNGLDAQVTMAGADLTLALAHLEATDPTDANRDGRVTQDEFATAMVRLQKFAANSLVVEYDGQPIQPGTPKLKLDDKDNFSMELTYPGARPARLRIRAALFKHLPPEHIHFVSVHDDVDKQIGNKMLKPNDDVLEIIAPERAERAQQRHTTFTDFLRLGVEHIWTGYDHLLFVLALLLVCNDFKSAIQVVTFFTVAHSITLAFATLNLASVSVRVVEPVIAASIVYVGVENVVRPEGPKARWLITFLFGLIHGFGFASVLRDLGVASNTTGLIVPLVAFNLGVEAGQLVIAAVLLPLIWKLRKWEPFVRRGVPACSAVVAAAGGYWLIQRVFFG